MPSETDMKGKVALVTGAAKGIGREIALRFANLRCDVMVSDLRFPTYQEIGRNGSQFNDAFEELKSITGDHQKFEGDLTRHEIVKKMFEQLESHYGKLDVLVNVAGGAVVEGAIFPHLGIEVKTGESDPTTFSEALLDANMEINYKTTVFSCQFAANIMKKQRSGKIINMSSVGGVMIQDKKFAPYGASKAAVLHYTHYLALELAGFGVTANAVLPGPVETERTVDLWKRMGTRDKLLAQVPMNRFGTTDDVANVVQFFASNLSDYVTGQALIVGGGVELSWK